MITLVSRGFRTLGVDHKRGNHPNIVSAIDVGQTDEAHFLAMELLGGVDLSKLVRRTGALSIATACELARQAAIGLQQIHDNGLVHLTL